METRLLDIFLEVVKSGSFSAAARKLNYSQPAVSQQVQTLERELGVQLFLRTGQSVQLTDAGLALVEECRNIFGVLSVAQDRVLTAAGLGKERVIRVAAFPSARALLVPRAIAHLKEADSPIRVNLIDVEPPDVIDFLKNKNCDIALSFTYEAIEPSLEIHSERLFTDEQVLLVGANHPVADQAVVELRHLAEESWIAGCPLCQRAFLRMCREQGFSPRIVCSTDDVQTVQELVRAQVGIAIRPALLGGLVRDNTAVVVRLLPKIQRIVSVNVLSERAEDPVLSKFIEALASAAQELGRTDSTKIDVNTRREYEPEIKESA